MEDKISQLKQEIIESATILREGGYLTPTFHGNISARIPGTNNIILTSRSYLSEVLSPDQLSVISLTDDKGLDQLHPSSLEIVNMHRIIYDIKKDVNAVIHTHSPFLTGYAIANQEIPCAYEAMVRHGVTTSIPVTEYGPRGSQRSIENIQSKLGENKAVLLANHGILAFSDTPLATAKVIVVIEEAAQMYVYANTVGSIKPIPQNLIKETTERHLHHQYRD